MTTIPSVGQPSASVKIAPHFMDCSRDASKTDVKKYQQRIGKLSRKMNLEVCAYLFLTRPNETNAILRDIMRSQREHLMHTGTRKSLK